MRNAMGLMAGPDSPPVTLLSRGLRDSASMDMARKVFTRLRASAPASAETLAICAIEVTLGDSLMMMGRLALERTRVTTYSSEPGSAPKAMPPACTLGHDTLSS